MESIQTLLLGAVPRPADRNLKSHTISHSHPAPRPVVGRRSSVVGRKSSQMSAEAIDDTTQRSYPSDPSDARWELLEPIPSARRAERRG